MSVRIHPALRAAFAGSLGAAVVGCSMAAASVEPPLRVVRQGRPDLPGLRNFAQVSYEGCLASKGQAPKPAPAMPDAALAALLVLEEEELFDGNKWAKYEVRRAVGADYSTPDCKIVVFHERSVTIETTCQSSLTAVGARLGDLMDENGAPVPKPEIHEEKASNPECDQPRHEVSLKGLRADDAGQGAQCVWNADLVARAAGAKTGADAAFDICLYTKRPFVYVKGLGRPVVLKSRSNDRSLTGEYIPAMFGQLAGYGNANLVTLSDGQPISVDRFSRSSAEAFLRQPVKTPIGSQR
ncbi:hypothetical protein AACH06_09690 [Ideonella sp. DXS29W]|uniref:Uncharacterized protein n=1 Tax=Ideonella lacteola TaxID=2984193 RepID=A0ABU9BR12_9BURK